MSQDVKKPRALREGSKILITAVSAVFDRAKFEIGLDKIREIGFLPVYKDDIFRRHDYLAGSDHERMDNLLNAITTGDADAIMFARGGYGIQRILGKMIPHLHKIDKLIVGFSDITPLLSVVTTHLGMSCVYGPVVTMLSSASDETMFSLRDILTSSLPPPSITDLRVIKRGSCKGRLVGGCLTLLSTSVGTDFDLKGDGLVLFLEDTGEKIYRYDRMLTHLKNTGLFERTTGILLGNFGIMEGEDEEMFMDVLEEVFDDFDGPVLYGVPSGHTDPFIPMPLGVHCEVEAESGGTVNFKEGVVA
jgi:muramoyltetrapeptide carboxypeptidase